MTDNLSTQSNILDTDFEPKTCPEAFLQQELSKVNKHLTSLESALETLVARCNNDFLLANDDAVISAEVALERLFAARIDGSSKRPKD